MKVGQTDIHIHGRGWGWNVLQRLRRAARCLFDFDLLPHYGAISREILSQQQVAEIIYS